MLPNAIPNDPVYLHTDEQAGQAPRRSHINHKSGCEASHMHCDGGCNAQNEKSVHFDLCHDFCKARLSIDLESGVGTVCYVTADVQAHLSAPCAKRRLISTLEI